jgi:hypothetical protein
VTLEPLDPRPEVEVLPLDVARPSFARTMTAAWEAAAVGRPFISLVSVGLRPAQLPPQSLRRLIGAAAMDESNDLVTLPVPPVPGPTRLPLGADKAPELIEFERLNSAWDTWLRDGGTFYTQRFQDGRVTDQQHTLDITNAAAVDRQDDNQPSDFWQAAEVGIIGKELPEATLTLEALLAVGSPAILFDVR